MALSTKYNERISTGYYLPAGIQLLVRVIDGDTAGWGIRIGAHSDNIGSCNELRRWPCVSMFESISGKREFNLSCPYGGLVYFESPGAGSLKVAITNVVEAPYIDLTKPETVADWRRRRNSPGLW